MFKLNIELIFSNISPDNVVRDGTGIAEEQIQNIRLMKSVLSNIHLVSGEHDITAVIDWSDYIKKAERNYCIEGKSFHEAIKYYKELPENEREAKVNCEITFKSISDMEAANNRSASHYMQMIFHHIFLAMNISCPGSFELYNTKYVVNKNENHTFKVSSYQIGFAFSQSVRDKWPLIERISLDKTWCWLINEANVSLHQIAKLPIERSLYALLHSCTNADYSPSSLLWVSHCIEGIYKTPRTGIVESLKRRSFIVLGEPPTHKKNFKKSFDKFYGQRSAFVHGTLDICHPANNDLLDDNYDDYIDNLRESHQFGLLIYLASLQILVKNNIVSFEFHEKLVM